MSNFEERLLSALKEEIATRTAEDGVTTTVTPAGRDRSRRRYVGLSAALAGVAAAATATAVVLSGLGGSPAYAVTEGDDGVITVRINRFNDPEGLQADLAEAGITAIVDYLPEGQTCKEPRGANGNGNDPWGFSLNFERSSNVTSFFFEKGRVPKGSTLVMAVSKSKAGDDQPPFGMSLTVVKGPVAPCEPIAMPAPGTQDGGGGFHTSTGDEGQGPSNDSATE
ncbi:hypothetical protein [Nonomuraea jabiensis]|uniref:Uncharacterized protein n=1 Tax=Nonomuraea jabiensis TaxID=882448 RepID=A0A7W9G071_9ACTN|nr:hypothetical protein [Nonomuraea jabiensis]MBB5774783.1 hypothetical protein [Nonomuraea jabiensis]